MEDADDNKDMSDDVFQEMYFWINKFPHNLDLKLRFHLC